MFKHLALSHFICRYWRIIGLPFHPSSHPYLICILQHKSYLTYCSLLNTQSSDPIYPFLICIQSTLCICLDPGIDRLERLKGIPLKLIAIEQFMEEQPQWRGKLIFSMIGKDVTFLTFLSLSFFLSLLLFFFFEEIYNRFSPYLEVIL